MTDAELDAAIDGDVSASASFNKTAESARRKKAAADLVKQIPEIFTPEQVVWVFDVYVGLICFVFSLLLKTEFKALHDELKLDEDVKILWAKPLARVASKYAPTEWAGMTAEIELIACLGLWTATAFGRAQNVAKKEAEKAELSKRATARNPVTVADAAHRERAVGVPV